MRNIERTNSIFEYKYTPEIIDIIEFLRKIGLKYIEISPIIPENSEIWLPLKKQFYNKGIYSIATYSLNFNIINKLLLKRNFKNCFSVLKGIFNTEEYNFILIQCIDIKYESIKNICDYLNNNKYTYKIENNNKTAKLIIKI